MKPYKKRLALVLLGLAALGVATALVVNALSSNAAFFYTPSQVMAGEAPQQRAFRVGGLVQPGSLQREQMRVSFVITDTVHAVPVHYTGILPDLFREGKGAVVQGRLDEQGRFVAASVLAKHDENYMPPEARHALEQAGKTGAAQP